MSYVSASAETRDLVVNVGNELKVRLFTSFSFRKPLDSRLVPSQVLTTTSPWWPWTYTITEGPSWNPFNRKVAQVRGEWSYIRIDIDDSNVLDCLAGIKSQYLAARGWGGMIVLHNIDDSRVVYDLE